MSERPDIKRFTAEVGGWYDVRAEIVLAGDGSRYTIEELWNGDPRLGGMRVYSRNSVVEPCVYDEGLCACDHRSTCIPDREGS